MYYDLDEKLDKLCRDVRSRVNEWQWIKINDEVRRLFREGEMSAIKCCIAVLEDWKKGLDEQEAKGRLTLVGG